MTIDFDPALPGDRELERRLEAYADLRLAPDPLASARDRRRVMAVAHRRAAFEAVSVPVPVAPLRRSRGRGWVGPFGAMTAALLTLGMLAGTAAAARPGGPLYGAFVTAERLTLPGEMTARAEAEARRLDLRLHEALSASLAGDSAAAAAAVSAYSTIVTEAGREVVGDRDALAWFQHHVMNHLPSLTAMLGVASEPARSALVEAIEGSTRFLGGGSSGVAPAAEHVAVAASSLAAGSCHDPALAAAVLSAKAAHPADRALKSAKAAHPAKSDKSAKAAHPAKSDKSAKAAHPAKSDKSAKAATPAKPKGPPRAAKPPRSGD